MAAATASRSGAPGVLGELLCRCKPGALTPSAEAADACVVTAEAMPVSCATSVWVRQHESIRAKCLYTLSSR